MSDRAIRWTGVCLDCRDAEEMAAFYGALLGWEVTARDSTDTRMGGAGWIAMTDPNGGVGLLFQAEDWYEAPVWPEEPNTQAKMIHLEMAVDDVEAAVAAAVAAGARPALHQPVDRPQDELRVMLDPAGHPFCLFAG